MTTVPPFQQPPPQGKKIADMTPEEQAARLAHLRARYRLRDKIKMQTIMSRRRRMEESVSRYVARNLDKGMRRPIKSLADLARRERTVILRRETRAMNLAYGFIRGRSYSLMEPICYTRPNWDHVREFVVQHSTTPEQVYLQQFAAWVDAANASGSYIAIRAK